MTRLPLVLSLALLLMRPCTLDASDSLSADVIVEKVLDSNLSLRQMAKSAETSVLELNVENSVGNTSIEFGREWGSKNVGNKLNLSLTQEFEWPGVYRTRSRAINALRRLNAAEYQMARENIMVRTRQLLIDIASQKQANHILERVSDGLESMLCSAEVKAASQSITVLELNKIRIEAASAKVAYLDGVAALNDMLNRLAELLACESVDFDTPDVVEYGELKTFGAYEKAVAQSAPVRAAAAKADYAKAMLKVAKSENIPGFALGYDFEQESGDTFHGFHIGVTLPLFSAKGKVAASKNNLMAVDLEQMTVETELHKSIEADYKLAESLSTQMDVFGPAIVIADNVALVQKAYDMGQLTLIDYFQELNYFLNVQLQFIDLQRRYSRTVVSLNRYF